MIVNISMMVKAKYEDYEPFTDTFEELQKTYGADFDDLDIFNQVLM